MFAEIRKQMIVDFVNQKSNVTLGELCEKFSVSPATVRNDLRALEKEGLLKRTHGGAISIRKVTYEPNAYQKEIEHVFKSLKVICVSYSYVLPIFLLHCLSFLNLFLERFLSFQYILDPILLSVMLLQIYPTSFYLVFSPILSYLLSKLKFLN